MDIELLSRMVEEAILTRNEVRLPGLGAFVAEFVPASFSDRGYTINPPYRRIDFRRDEGEDNTLALLYASQNNTDPASAETLLRDFTKELKQTLEETGVVLFPELGKLRLTPEGECFFVGEPDLCIYPEGFGLQAVSLKAHAVSVPQLAQLAQEVAQDVAPVEKPAAPSPAVTVVSTDSGKKKSGKVFWRIVLVAIVVFVLLLAALRGAAVLFPDFVDSLLYSAEELELLSL